MSIRLPALLGVAVLLACARSGPDPWSLAAPVEGGLAPPWTPIDDARGEDPRADPVRDVVYTEPGELPRLEAAAGVVLPLRDTAVRAHLRGDIAEVVVRQRFVNDNAAPLEAVYTFPLPENSAVTDMRIVLGERVIEAEIHERGAARQVFADARQAGHTAALLEQERPNVFTQSITNIPPGEAIDVELRYLQTLSHDAGEYEFVFPTVVGPRYIPGEPLARAPVGAGVRADTDRVPDASRISPPILGRGQRTGHDLSIEVVAEASAPITAWAAPMHAVEARVEQGRLAVALARRDEIPNRDFVLRYRSAGARPTARLFLGPGGAGGGHFMLVVDPPRLDVDDLVGARELLFVIDVSGSMSGAPLALAKAALRAALAAARPVDTFDVVTFSGRTARLYGAPRPANAANLAQAVAFVDGLQAGGGTEVRAAVEDALRAPVEGDRHRYVFLMTDGYTGEEEAIAREAHALVERQRRAGRVARVFGVGIGSAPNTQLIALLSRAGRGAPTYLHTQDDVPRATQTFRRTIDAPVLTDLALEWGKLAVHDLSSAPTDLFATGPLVVHGRYTGDAAAAGLHLRGWAGPRSVTIPIEVVPAGESDVLLGRLWARDRIGALDLRMAIDANQVNPGRAEILALGLQHHLVTAYTSLVAVDRARRVDGAPRTIVQPVEIPQGVDPDAAGAVSQDGVQVTHLDVSRMHAVPIGGTARDFTAVVDVSPTASQDAVGIRLQGTTGAESKYVIDGAHVTSALVQEYTTPLDHGAGFVAVEPSARVNLRAVASASKTGAASLRADLGADRSALARCFEQAAEATYRIRRDLTLRLRRSLDGALVHIDVRGREPLDASIATCLRGHLDPLVRRALAPGQAAEVQLRVWMRF